MPSLREKHRELTDQLIMDAFTELTVSNPNFTMQDLADHAGISLRTLYRYYPKREALVDGLMRSVDGKVRLVPTSIAELTEQSGALRHNFGVFDEHRDLVKAMVMSRLSGALVHEAHRARTESIRTAVSRELKDHDGSVQRQVAGLLRLLMSSVTWMTLTDEDIGLTGDEAGAAAEWAARLVIENARRASGPLE